MNVLKYLIIYIIPFLDVSQNLPILASEEWASEVVPSALPVPVKAAEKSVYGLFIEGKGSGTGFFIAPDLFVTNFHVIQHAESLDDMVLFQNQERSPIKVKKVYAVDGLSDLALLQTDRRSEHFLSQGPAPQSSDQVFSIGYSGYNKGMPVFTSSIAEIIKHPLYYTMAFDTENSLGSSGSPLLNSLGQVIGVFFVASYNIRSNVTAATLNQLMKGEKGIVCEGSGRTCIDRETQRVRREFLHQIDSEDQTIRALEYINLKQFLSQEQIEAHLLKGAENKVTYVHAQYLVGSFFVAQKEFEEGFYWIHQAAEQNDPVAQNEMGILYLRGIGTASDVEEAYQWFKKSSDQKFTVGMLHTAHALLTGSGVEQDIDQAISLLREAARYGNKEAWHSLGVLPYYGWAGVIEPDPSAAVPYFLQAAEFGHKDAACRMEVFYEEGKWVEKDLEILDYWHEQCEDL